MAQSLMYAILWELLPFNERLTFKQIEGGVYQCTKVTLSVNLSK